MWINFPKFCLKPQPKLQINFNKLKTVNWTWFPFWITEKKWKKETKRGALLPIITEKKKVKKTWKLPQQINLTSIGKPSHGQTNQPTNQPKEMTTNDHRDTVKVYVYSNWEGDDQNDEWLRFVVVVVGVVGVVVNDDDNDHHVAVKKLDPLTVPCSTDAAASVDSAEQV